MSREELFLKIQRFLSTRRDTLRSFLARELSNLGTDEDEESLNEAYIVTAESESKELELIQAALERMRDGSYGTCETCDGEIHVERVKALPCATLCINCQRDREASPRRSMADFSKIANEELAV